MKKFFLIAASLIVGAACFVGFTNATKSAARDIPQGWPEPTALKDISYSTEMYNASNIVDIISNLPTGGGGTVSNAFKIVNVGNTNIVAVNEDTLKLIAGDNVTLIPNDTDKSITINSICQNGEKRIARFDIPLNYAVNSATTWGAFELKATTNNFSQEVSEYNRLLYYSQSEIAHRGKSIAQAIYDYTNNVPPRSLPDDMDIVYNHALDRMWLFTCSAYDYPDSEDVGPFDGDSRSYRYIRNTQFANGWTNKILSVVVLVDTEALERHREQNNNVWLKNSNEELIWCYHRIEYVNTNPTHEREAGTNSPQWRVIAPVCWYSEMPKWASEQITNYWPRANLENTMLLNQ